MAKKRKKEKEKEEEEYEFRPPDFNEEEFLTKEIRDTKATMFTIGYAAAFGATASVVTVFVPDMAMLGFLIVIAGLISLPFFYKFVKIDTSTFQKKNWAGNFAMFFFTFLAIWTLLINTPFADLTDPTVKNVAVWIDSGGTLVELEYKYVDDMGGYSWVYGNTTIAVTIPIPVNPADTLNITARVADNGKLASAQIALGTQSNTYYDMNKTEKKYIYDFKVPGSAITSTGLMFYIRAVDEKDNTLIFIPEAPIPVRPL